MGALKVIGLIMVLVVVAVGYEWAAIDQLIIALVVFLVVTFVWSRLALRGLMVVRSLSSDRVRVGQTVREELTIRNQGWLPKLWVEVRDYSTVPGHELSRVVRLGPRRVATWDRTTVCWQRGQFRMGPLVLHAGDPFGIFTVRRTLPITHELIVYPPVFNLSAFPLPMSSLYGGRVRTRQLAMATPSVAGVRGYVAGDPLNRISWSATARTGTMMVKDLDPDPSADVWIVLDFDAAAQWHATTSPPVRGDAIRWLYSTEEYGVAIAASLAERCLTEGRNVGLIVNRGQPVRILPDHNERQWLRIFELLAVATAQGSRPLAVTLAQDAARFNRQSAVIVISPSVETEWAAALGALRERHIPVTAVVLDASSFDRSAPASDAAVETLHLRRVPVMPVRYGEDPAIALASRGTDVA